MDAYEVKSLKDSSTGYFEGFYNGLLFQVKNIEKLGILIMEFQGFHKMDFLSF